jgi:peptide/nickel transport system ATP-binding protein
MSVPILETINLSKRFQIGSRLSPAGIRTVHAVNEVSLRVMAGETVGIVGESGCGKTTLGRCMVRLYEITSGRLQFHGREITTSSLREMRPLRRYLQMVFQDPYASLNPRRRVFDLVAEPLRVHGNSDEASIRARVMELFEIVGLHSTHAQRFPHEFSGGQRQRIGIARAIALEPQLIVLDEPVSALDVSVRAQIVNLLADLQERLKLTYVFIAHDLSIVRQISTRIAVMYLGSIVELGDAEDIFARPAHPYTYALLSAIPGVSKLQFQERVLLRGDVPSPIDPPNGCRFHPRCPIAQARCKTEQPALIPVFSNRTVACHFPLTLRKH